MFRCNLLSSLFIFLCQIVYGNVEWYTFYAFYLKCIFVMHQSLQAMVLPHFARFIYIDSMYAITTSRYGKYCIWLAEKNEEKLHAWSATNQWQTHLSNFPLHAFLSSISNKPPISDTLLIAKKRKKKKNVRNKVRFSFSRIYFEIVTVSQM